MSSINPSNPNCLTDQDVDYAQFSCCGDEDLVFLRCSGCGHIWVECFECSTWFVDLNRVDLKESCLLTNDEHRNHCPECNDSFKDLHYLADKHCHDYLPTREQVVAAGLTRFLSDGQKQRPVSSAKVNNASQGLRSKAPKAPKATNKAANTRPKNSWMVLAGSTIGAMGWIIGVGLSMFSEGFSTDGWVALICSLGVALVGIWLWLKSSSTPVSLWTASLTLLATSFVCGLAACIWCHNQGSLEQVIDPNGKFPDAANFLAPVILLIMISALFMPALKEKFQSYRI